LRRAKGQHRVPARRRGIRPRCRAGKDFGVNIGVAPGRCYPDYETLIAEEAKRDDGVEVVSVATPNATHYDITKACLEAGLHVICEKSLFFTVKEVEEVKALAEDRGLTRIIHERQKVPISGHR
jgi:predicted dehydrogenase